MLCSCCFGQVSRLLLPVSPVQLEHTMARRVACFVLLSYFQSVIYCNSLLSSSSLSPPPLLWSISSYSSRIAIFQPLLSFLFVSSWSSCLSESLAAQCSHFFSIYSPYLSSNLEIVSSFSSSNLPLPAPYPRL